VMECIGFCDSLSSGLGVRQTQKNELPGISPQKPMLPSNFSLRVSPFQFETSRFQ
jgi:hypothetical protein